MTSGEYQKPPTPRASRPTAPLEKLRRFREILARVKNLDEAVEEFRKLR